MLNFQEFTSPETHEDELEPIPAPTIGIQDSDGRYGKYVAEPLPRGYATTLGNALRRVLYNSLPGTAVTWVKIEGILHEYATIPHIKEEVSEILLNIKGIRLRSDVERSGKIRLEVAGRGEVSAGDIMATSDYEIINPELHIATLDSDEASLSIEFNVERGVSYQEAAAGDGLSIGVLPVDAVYSPVRKVNYRKDTVRIGQQTDLERLTIEIWTDGTITPINALQQAGNILVTHFFLFANAERVTEGGTEGSPIALQISPDIYSITVESLNLSARSLNCLKRASLDQVGQILEMKPADLLEIRNFGEKSLHELYDRLREMDLIPPEIEADLQIEETAEVTKTTTDDNGEEAKNPGDTEISVDAIFSEIEGLGDE